MENMTTPQSQDWNNFWSRGQSERFSKVSWSKRRIIKVLNRYIKPGSRALDAGCGSGFFSNYFIEQNMTSVSLDYSQSALEMAQKITGGRTQIVQADLLTDNLQSKISDQFDLIFSDGLFEHFSENDQNRIVKNLTPLLKNDGVLVTFVPNRWSPWELIRPLFMPGIEEKPFVLSELVNLNSRNGLSILEKGGVNTLPFGLSPEILAPHFGMLLYTVAESKVS